MARTLIRNGIVLPMTGGASVLDPGSVLVDGDSIVAVGPVDAQAAAEELFERRERVLAGG